MLFYYLLNF